VVTTGTVARDRRQRRFRAAVLAVSALVAVGGAMLLATRDWGERVTTRGVTATLGGVPGHPGSVAAGKDALWVALVDAKRPVTKQPILRLDLSSKTLRSPVDLEGQATYLLHAGDRLLASVAHPGSNGSGPSRIVALDWRTGEVQMSTQFRGAVGPLVQSGTDVWALQTQPGELVRLNGPTLAQNAPQVDLPPGRSLGLAVGGGYVWVSASDAGELLRIDPATRKITALRVGGFPMGIAFAGGSVWLADRERGTVARIEPRTLRPIGEPIQVGSEPSALAVAGDYLFVGRAGHGTVTRIDVGSGKKVGVPIRFGPPGKSAFEVALAPSGASVWTSSFDSSTLTRISSATASAPPRAATVAKGRQTNSSHGKLPRAARVAAEISIPPGPAGLAIGEGAVWILSEGSSSLLRIDPRTNAVVKRIEVETGGEVAVGDGSVWLTHPDTETVSRMNPRTYEVSASIRVGKRPLGIAVTSEAVWVANADVPSVSRIDPETGRVVKTIRVGPAAACCGLHMGVIVAGGAVWANVSKGRMLARIDPATNAVSFIKLDYEPCAALVANERTVWSTGGGCADVVARIDVRSNDVTKLAEPHPIGLASAFGRIWVANLRSQNVDQLDLRTHRVVARLPVGGTPIQLLSGFGSLWMHDDEGRVLRIEPLR
jgi:DNA-binding beta-propeller fold protein YncE